MIIPRASSFRRHRTHQLARWLPCTGVSRSCALDGCACPTLRLAEGPCEFETRLQLLTALTMVSAIAACGGRHARHDDAYSTTAVVEWDSGPLDRDYRREHDVMEARHREEIANARADESAERREARQAAERTGPRGSLRARKEGAHEEAAPFESRPRQGQSLAPNCVAPAEERPRVDDRCGVVSHPAAHPERGLTHRELLAVTQIYLYRPNHRAIRQLEAAFHNEICIRGSLIALNGYVALIVARALRVLPIL